MTPTEEKLKACPFHERWDSESAERVEVCTRFHGMDIERSRVECYCGARGPVVQHSQAEGDFARAEAIKLWNTRHPDLSAVVKRAVELGREVSFGKSSRGDVYSAMRYSDDEILSIINKEFGS